MSNWLSSILLGFESAIASYRSLITQTILYGALNVSGSGDTKINGQIADSAIPTAERTLTRCLNMGQLIEELSRNLTLSYFSASRLHLPGGIETIVDIGSTPNIYQYNFDNLAWAYGIAIAATVISAIVGIRAMLANGVSHETSFLSILCSTRNATLDDLTIGPSLAAEPLGTEIKNTKLRFGLLQGPNVEPGLIKRVGFGIQEEVETLKKGAACY